MVRAGAFSDVDIAITWHPGAFAGLNEPLSLANTRIDFSFTGRASHAAASPHLGRSALDAVELMNVGVNYMREHMPPDARVHYALLDAGGVAPNVVQAHAKVRYLIRARDLPELNRLILRVRKIADGAALMTETSVATQVVSAVSNLLGNTPLEKAMYANMERLGPPPFDDADRAFAAKIQDTLNEEDIETSWRRVGLPVQSATTLCDVIVPFDAKGAPMMGSTDVGDVSWAVPTVQARGATYAIGTPGHSWQLTAQGDGARRQGDGRHRAGRDPRPNVAGPCQSRSPGAPDTHPLRLSDPRRRAASDQHVRGSRLKRVPSPPPLEGGGWGEGSLPVPTRNPLPNQDQRENATPQPSPASPHRGGRVRLLDCRRVVIRGNQQIHRGDHEQGEQRPDRQAAGDHQSHVEARHRPRAGGGD